MSSSLTDVSIRSWSEVAGPIGSNSDQNYLTHGLLRYFGKLPPVLTGQIIDLFGPRSASGYLVDLMCGSGTTLVEAQARGFQSFGVDANEIAVLASRVKTRRPPLREIRQALTDYDLYSRSVISQRGDDGDVRDRVPVFPNRDRWFTRRSQAGLARAKQWVETFSSDTGLYEFLLLSWIGVIRASSQASVRTGRIFFDHDKPEPDVFALLGAKLRRNYEIVAAIPDGHFDTKSQVWVGDARTSTLELATNADLVLLHPPYFALYRYSSDVLRFELEWACFSRKNIAAREIEDGFKTTNAELMFSYVGDLVAAMKNGLSHLRPGGHLVVVVGNSTLSDKQLPVVETILSSCELDGIHCQAIFEREIAHSQVTYHRSANPNIRSDNDFVLIFPKA